LNGQPPRLLIATDLDGCLLDETSYSFDAARPALAALHAGGVPLVLASSKTRAEMEVLAGQLAPVAGLIVENGGAIVWPEGSPLPPVAGARRYGYGWFLELSIERASLVAALAGIGTALGIQIRGFSDLSVTEIAEITGLSREAAVLAAAREYDEPFLLDQAADVPRVVAAAESRGLRVTRGGRFHHLTGNTGKGRALRMLLAAHDELDRPFITVGLGDSANDQSLLEAVDRPVVVPRADGRADPVLAVLPRIRFAPAPGPRGWNAAVLEVLAGECLPPPSAAIDPFRPD
jgi:mannosyl-3-phosphoglycerate phosphatase